MHLTTVSYDANNGDGDGGDGDQCAADGDEHNIIHSNIMHHSEPTAVTIFGHLCSEALAGAGLSWKDTRSRDGFLESARGDQLRDGSSRHA